MAIDRKIADVADAFYAFTERLEAVKEFTREERRALTRAIPPERAGYWMALFNALYREQGVARQLFPIREYHIGKRNDLASPGEVKTSEETPPQSHD